MMKNKNIIAVSNLIQCLEIESLRNHIVVSNLVRAFGLVQWGPPVFGSEELFKNPSEDMAGIYQTPAQIAKALVYLSDIQINTFLEIGVFQGGNFLFMSEYLRRFNPDIRCFGIDPTNYINPEIRQIIDLSEWMRFASVTSDQIQGRRFDLVFIDGDHTENWIKRDYENVGRHAKVCMIHDIQETSCPDIVAFWNGLRMVEDKVLVELLDCSTDVPLHGIGIIHGKEMEMRA
jgi:hypothetical protein